MRPFILLGLMAAAAPLAAQSADFRWHGSIPAGQVLEIKGVNGAIRATGVAGGEAEVTASKHGRRSDPDEVEIKVVQHSGGVTICALYPTPSGERANTCEPGEGGRMNSRNNDVAVDFTVRVPAGVRFVGNTVNGGVEARGLKADAEVATVNGSATVESDGVTRAHTVNGDIHASMGRTDWNGTVELATVNGSITVALPANANLTVSGKTVNGDIDTEFPLTVKGRWGPRHLSGTIGSGGHDLELQTVNGSIALRKR